MSVYVNPVVMEKADTAKKLYTWMRLWDFPDQYIVEPTDGSGGSILQVSRVDGSMKLIDDVPQCNSVRGPDIQTIYGVAGMIKLLTVYPLFRHALASVSHSSRIQVNLSSNLLTELSDAFVNSHKVI
ncbi:phosphoinositide phosphatase SAC7-like isoform X3 [Impatiens glandulifera]|uniref:phosphoinositide phosphatase SAC7-like isoform X3 n=1 Tax=Impatiens glandulifera TaxID=253017 RepID=UPI001FB17A13|nr:phosphoinositide phosphatase SAC7-like isoform X3 [Impatiens glandulifera]